MKSKLGQQWSALAGVLFSVIFLIGFLLFADTPNFDAGGEEVISYYNDDGKIYASLFMLWAAAIFFMFFAGGLRSRLQAANANWLVPVAFGGMIMVVVGIGLFMSGQVALLDAAKLGEPQVAQALNIIDNDNFPVFLIGIAITVLATAWHALSTHSLPMWLGWVTLLLGIIAIIPPIAWINLLLFPIWVIVVSILMFLGSRREEVVETNTTL
ncbi:MAG: hypothetical protein H0T78_03170 [Longispora sp.]|nr:hypothetical protein [Longispora sp. (in: high G+C Gram-positive bacteria)]